TSAGGRPVLFIFGEGDPAGPAGARRPAPKKGGPPPGAPPRRPPPRAPGSDEAACSTADAQHCRGGKPQGSRGHARPAGDRLQKRVALRKRRPGETEERKREREGSDAEPRVPGNRGDGNEEGDETETAKRHAERAEPR